MSRWHRTGAPLMVARSVCPECATDLPAAAEDAIVACPGCGRSLLYETLDQRLGLIEARLDDIENRVRVNRHDLLERVQNPALDAVRRRLDALEAIVARCADSPPNA